MKEHVEEIERSQQDSTLEEFRSRTREQAEKLREMLKSGEFENQDFTIGLELEAYAVDEEGHVAVISDEVLDQAPFAPELGMHNAELNTDPDVLDPEGLRDQSDELESLFSEANRFLSSHGMRLTLDSVWTLHPEDGEEFLKAVQEHGDHSFAENMRSATRYHILNNAITEHHDGGIEFDVPGASQVFPSMLFECLATSLQPHLQVPLPERFAEYFNAANRTMAPVLALTTNSPFLPPELYNDYDDPRDLVEESLHELRVPIFERSVNPGSDYGEKKVRFPRDLESTEELFEAVAEDHTYDPALSEWREEKEGFRSEFWEWNYQRKTFWRWNRPVVGGEPVEGACDERSLRLEYRPVPTQPSVKDILSVQALVVGAVHGIVEEKHPVAEVDWSRSKSSFYDVVEDGLNAELAWKSPEHGRTSDQETVFEELFGLAEAGLADRGVPQKQIDELLQPMKVRWRKGMTPSTWKKREVMNRLRNGATLEHAIHGMQQEYIQLSHEKQSFAEWIE
jgi:hypothetical protein